MSRIILIEDDLPDSATTYIDDVDSGFTNSTSHSLSIDIGAEASASEGNRLVVIALHGLSSAPFTVTGTIGGVTLQSSTQYVAVSGVSRYSICFIWAYVPTGTSATVALTLSTSALIRLRSFRSVNITSSTPTDSDGNTNAGSVTSVGTSLDVIRGGAAIVAGTGFGDGTWSISGVNSGVGEGYTLAGGWSADARLNGGSLNVTSDETARSISITKTGSFASTAMTVAAISFR